MAQAAFWAAARAGRVSESHLAAEGLQAVQSL